MCVFLPHIHFYPTTQCILAPSAACIIADIFSMPYLKSGALDPFRPGLLSNIRCGNQASHFSNLSLRNKSSKVPAPKRSGAQPIICRGSLTVQHCGLPPWQRTELQRGLRLGPQSGGLFNVGFRIFNGFPVVNWY